MTISMWMLHDILEASLAFTGLDERAENLNIRGLLPYRGSDRIRTDHVYLIAAEKLPQVLSLRDGCFLVYGAAEKPKAAGLFLCLKPSIGADEALWLALNAFERYNHWYEELQAELAEQPDLKKLCHAAYELLGNPVTLFDPGHALIARGGDSRDYSEILEEKPGFQLVLSDEAYKALVNRPEHREDIQPHTPVIVSSPFEQGRLLYVDILCGQREYRLCASETERPFRPGDAQLLLVFSDVLRMALQADHSRDDLAKRDLISLLEGLLSGELQDLRGQEHLLRPWGWSSQDRYLCLCMEKKRTDRTFVLSDRFICTRLEELLGDACAIMTDRRIACLCHLTAEETPAAVCARLEPFLQDNIFLLGVSEPFQGLERAEVYYREAMAAIRAERTEESGSAIRCFGDAAVTMLLREGLSGLPSYVYCLPELDKLRRLSDARVDYIETLRVYVENERNLLLSAAKLRIHRTTLFYRLGRIREALGLDLEDPDVRFRILLSFRLMEL